MSYLKYRSDSSIQLNLSIWDNLNSVDSNQAILNLLEQNPPDFIIGPGFGGKSNSMLRLLPCPLPKKMAHLYSIQDAQNLTPRCLTETTSGINPVISKPSTRV